MRESIKNPVLQYFSGRLNTFDTSLAALYSPGKSYRAADPGGCDCQRNFFFCRISNIYMTMVSSPSILLIDDDPKQIQFLAAILRRHDYRVFAALDGRDGLAKAAAKPPDLILVDLYMPDIDGQATIRLFKAHPSLQHIPLICLTVSNHIDDKLSAFEAGAVDYITKPFDPEEVLARVRVHLRLHQAGVPQPVLPPPPMPSVEGPPQQWEERLVNQAQSVLLREMGNPPSLAELAQRVGTTQRHLSHEFRRQVGVAVFAWLREERHREACSRLLHTSQQLNQIGHHIGYHSAAAFTNAFRARFGMTPSDYRRAAGVRVPEADTAAADEEGQAQGHEDAGAGGYAAG